MSRQHEAIAPSGANSTAAETDNIIPSTSSYTTTAASLAQSVPASRTSRFFSQFGLFAAGAATTAFSVLLTRRAVANRVAAIRPKGLFTPSNKPLKVNGGAEAAEALGLATLNVTSFAFMITTGLMWALDISDLEEMRTRLRRQMGLGLVDAGLPDGLKDKDGAVKEDDVEMWMSVIAARMQGKSDEEVSAMVMSRVDPEDKKEE
ncbi:hypothetical protein MBLNU457_4779t1 [Dothideomycetes sp. NU457]